MVITIPLSRNTLGILMTTESHDLSLTCLLEDTGFLKRSGPVIILQYYNPHRPQGERLLLASLISFSTSTSALFIWLQWETM